MAYLVKPCCKIHGILILPPDKSICHRAIILSSLSEGPTLINHFSFSQDCVVTMRAFQALGVRIRKAGKDGLRVEGVGFRGLKKPGKVINMGESGTSVRILLGLLSAQGFVSCLDGKSSLRKRPMLRVIQPVRLMGARIKARKIGKDEYLPLKIYPSSLKSLNWKMNVPSAQVKSAILLAGLYARGKTIVYEPVKTRDHTERMLKCFKADIKVKGKSISIRPCRLISPKELYIPADISSAAFFIVLAVILKKSYLKLKNLGLNPTRSGIINVLKRMGADIKIVDSGEGIGDRNFEPMGDVIVRSSKLKGVVVKEKEIPALIDELPVLMVAASLARGVSIFEGVGELRIKETDRIDSMLKNLSLLGVEINVKKGVNGKESVMIKGAKVFKGGGLLRSFGDHRTAMSMVVASLCADSPCEIDDVRCISKSLPEFFKLLHPLLK